MREHMSRIYFQALKLFIILVLCLNGPLLWADTVVIYLIGLAGTGKYTIAQKIAENYHYKVVDNHLLSNPLFSLLSEGEMKNLPEGTTDKIQRIREIVFEFIREDENSNYVLTNQLLEREYHHGIYQQVLGLAEQRKSLFVPVKLTISNTERAKRIVKSDRAERFKITEVEEAYRPQDFIKFKHKNLLTLEVSNLSADAVAEKIMSHVHTLKTK